MISELLHRPLVSVIVTLILGILFKEQPATILAFFGILYLTMSVKSAIWIPCFGFLIGVVIPTPNVIPITKETFFNGSVQIRTIPKKTKFGIQATVLHKNKSYLLYDTKKNKYALGDQLSVIGKLKPFSHNSAQYWTAKGVSGIIKPLKPVIIIRKGHSIWTFCQNCHTSFVQFSNKFLHHSTAPLINAITINERSFLDSQTKVALVKSGTLHIVSTSGLHVIILAGMLIMALSLLPIPRSIALVVLALLLFIYASISGMNPPAIRATIMATIIGLAYIFKRESDSLSALAFVGIIYLVWKPLIIYDVGFQLSFVCTAFLILFGQSSRYVIPKTSLQYILMTAYQILRASTVAIIASAPLIAYHFGTLSTLSILANILILPLLPLILLATFLGWVFSFISPTVSIGLAKAVIDPLAGWILLVLNRISNITFSNLQIPTLAGIVVLFFYIAFIMLWRPHVRQA